MCVQFCRWSSTLFYHLHFLLPDLLIFRFKAYLFRPFEWLLITLLTGSPRTCSPTFVDEQNPYWIKSLFLGVCTCFCTPPSLRHIFVIPSSLTLETNSCFFLLQTFHWKYLSIPRKLSADKCFVQHFCTGYPLIIFWHPTPCYPARINTVPTIWKVSHSFMARSMVVSGVTVVQNIGLRWFRAERHALSLCSGVSGWTETQVQVKIVAAQVQMVSEIERWCKIGGVVCPTSTELPWSGNTGATGMRWTDEQEWGVLTTSDPTPDVSFIIITVRNPLGRVVIHSPVIPPQITQ